MPLAAPSAPSEANSSISTTATVFGPGFFNRMSTNVAEHIFSYLDDRSHYSYFRVFAMNKENEYQAVREGAFNNSVQQFLQYVVDAKMQSAEAILDLVKKDKWQLFRLLTTKKTLIQKNGLPMTGTALEIAIKCWDWSLYEVGLEEMTEMLKRYMRMLEPIQFPGNISFLGGAQAIEEIEQRLLPIGLIQHQKVRAAKFSQSILEPMLQTLKTASTAEIKLVYALTNKSVNEVDEYITTVLEMTPLWQSLMHHHEAIKAFMQEDMVYNPYYLFEAVALNDAKSRDIAWRNQCTDCQRCLPLFAIHGLGGIQARSPTVVGMIFARGKIANYNDYHDDLLKSAPQIERDCNFKSGEGNIFARTASMLLIGKKSCDFGRGSGKWNEQSSSEVFSRYIDQKQQCLNRPVLNIRTMRY